MKKFFTFLFVCLFFNTSISQASISDMADMAKSHPKISPQSMNETLKKMYSEIPDINDTSAINEYVKKRLQKVLPVNIDPNEITMPQSTSLIDLEELSKKHQKTLSDYEKIYNASLKRAESNSPLNNDATIEGTFYQLVDNKQDQEQFIPDFPYVTIKLSDTKEIIAPAEEHIAYLLTTIKIEPTSFVNITEEFTIVSNNEAFPNGFFRILPKYIQSRNNKKRRLDISLSEVSVNGDVFPYKITEVGNYLYIEPEKPLKLPTGIYTYKFSYLVDRAIWNYSKLDEFYWNITGSTLNYIVGSANALVILPDGKEFFAQNAIAKTNKGVISDRVTITNLATNTLAFADTEALSIGEDILIALTFEKDTFITPDFSRKFFWFIQDFGAEIFALLILLSIFFSYKISLQQIYQNQDKRKLTLARTPALYRLINSNSFDMRSLCAEMLDLISKNIISISQNGEQTVLVKKTDNLQNLNKEKKKLVQILFPGTETILPANNISKLKLQRAYTLLKRNTLNKYTFYIFRLNSIYILSSILMILLGIFATSSISVNPTHTFAVMLVCSIILSIYIYLFQKQIKRKWLSLLVKLFSISSTIFIADLLAIYTSVITTILTIANIYIIFHFYKLFSKRNGLLRNKIRETEEYKSYLQKNTEFSTQSKDFSTKVPYIYAFGIENKYKDTTIFEQINKFEHLN